MEIKVKPCRSLLKGVGKYKWAGTSNSKSREGDVVEWNREEYSGFHLGPEEGRATERERDGLGKELEHAF